MPVAHISRPAIALAPHAIPTSAVVGQIRADHPDHPRPRLIDRLGTTCGVETRHFVDPLHVVATPGEFADRNRRAFAHVCTMGSRAARQLLAEQHIDASGIDGLVTSHATGIAIPGLDIHLVNDLGLPPTVARVAMSQAACSGGAQALIHAARLIRSGCKQVLVVVAETLSNIYHSEDNSAPAHIFQLLFGDSAGAVLVTADRREPGPVIDLTGDSAVQDNTFEYTLPGSQGFYYERLEADGVHFDSTKDALRAIDIVTPHVIAWSQRYDPLWAPQFAVLHPGSPQILDSFVKGLSLSEDRARHSRRTLRDVGNLGGVAVLHTLALAFDEPPADGAPGLLIAVGPGFVTAATKLIWNA